MTGREALEAARAFIAPFAEPEETYGFFPGGDYDPRAFTPDEDSNAAEEHVDREAADVLAKIDRALEVRGS